MYKHTRQGVLMMGVLGSGFELNGQNCYSNVAYNWDHQGYV